MRSGRPRSKEHKRHGAGNAPVTLALRTRWMTAFMVRVWLVVRVGGGDGVRWAVSS